MGTDLLAQEIVWAHDLDGRVLWKVARIGDREVSARFDPELSTKP